LTPISLPLTYFLVNALQHRCPAGKRQERQPFLSGIAKTFSIIPLEQEFGSLSGFEIAASVGQVTP